MLRDPFPGCQARGVALAIPVTIFFGLVMLVCFFVVFKGAGICGPINDACNGLGAVLGAVLAWRLRPWLRERSPRWSGLALVSAIVGAALAVLGSVLVITSLTGWLLAGLYTALGYALIGLWLLTLGLALLRTDASRGFARTAVVAGALMSFGLIVLPAIVQGFDDADHQPWYVQLSFFGFMGWGLVYPVWCGWLSRAKPA